MKRSVTILAGLCAIALAGCSETSATSSAADAPAPVAAPATAAATNTAAAAEVDLMAEAATVVGLCQSTMPNSKAFQDQLTARGYRFEGIDAGLRVLSLDNRRLVAFGTTKASRHTACGVSFKGMTSEQAVALAQPWIRAAGAAQIPLDNTRLRSGIAWDGVFKDTPVRIAIMPDRKMGFMRGTILMAGTIE